MKLFFVLAVVVSMAACVHIEQAAKPDDSVLRKDVDDAMRQRDQSIQQLAREIIALKQQAQPATAEKK